MRPADEREGPIRIVIADDHAMVRSGLRMVLDSHPGFAVVGEAGDVDGAIERARELRPDVVVLDLSMPGRLSLPAIPEVLAAAPGAAVVVMTMHGEAASLDEALAAGAAAFVLKETADEALSEAVCAAAAGKTFLDPGMTGRRSTPPGTPLDPVDDLPAGTGFAGHRIDGVAGRGGMGVVYRAVDVALDRVVALKVLHATLGSDPLFRARFERECRLAAALDHPRVVQVFHAGEEAGHLYVSMRLVEGTDLRALLGTEPRLAPSRAAALVADVAAALGAAHERGLVHRDVKPANVLVGHADGREAAFLTDFGISKERAIPSDLTGTGVTMGTPDYMAPEQTDGRDVDGRADIYALGCVLHEALTGVPPFPDGSAVDKLWSHLHVAPASVLDRRPGLPPALGRAVDHALAKDPGDRPATARAFADEALAAVRDAST